MGHCMCREGVSERLANQHRCSYPGYSEILTGRADDARITGNNVGRNPYPSMLERLRDELGLAPAQVAVFAVGVVAQESCGLGGGGFLLYRGSDGTAAVLDFRETAPANLPSGFETEPRRFAGTGHQVVGVPGTVAGMAEVVDRYGSRPLERLLGPAIALAERGVRLTPFQTEVVRSEQGRLDSYDESRELYLDDGEVPAPWPVGRERIQSDLARTLRTLADQGPDAFYRGSIAEAIVAEMER